MFLGAIVVIMDMYRRGEGGGVQGIYGDHAYGVVCELRIPQEQRCCSCDHTPIPHEQQFFSKKNQKFGFHMSKFFSFLWSQEHKKWFSVVIRAMDPDFGLLVCLAY